MKKDLGELIAKRTFIVLAVTCIAYAAVVFIFIL